MHYNHELILPNQDLPFKLFIFEGKDGHYIRDKHWHQSVEIFAVCEGELSFYLDQREYPLAEGQFMLVNSNEVHSVSSPKPNDTIVIQIPLSLFSSYFTGEQFIWFSHSSPEHDGQLMELVREIYSVYCQKACGYDLKVLGLFYLLLHLLVSEYRRTDMAADRMRQSKNLNRLSHITSYIKEHYSEDLNLESLARTFGYSPTYLSRMFQKYAGINFKAYLQDIRLRYAWRELGHSEETLSAIAQNNGFPDSRAFARAFRKKYHLLPSQYRETLHQKGQEIDID